MTEGTGEGSVLQGLSNDLARAVERAAAATVTIHARRRQPASGIVWAEGGVILTANHVIEREEEIRISLPDGKEAAAMLLGRDAGTDIAILRAQAGDLTPVERGPLPPVGSLVLAVARPGEGPMATLGVVSAVGGPARTWRGGQIDRFIRTDVILYPGFSGGPLVDAAGRAAGMNTSFLSRGSAIAIPVEAVAKVADALVSHGRVRRGYLGISSQPVDLPAAVSARVNRSHGLLILSVVEGGPAETAGVILGDVLTGFAGEAIEDTDDLQRVLAARQTGETASLTVLRGGEPCELSVTIGERPPGS